VKKDRDKLKIRVLWQGSKRFGLLFSILLWAANLALAFSWHIPAFSRSTAINSLGSSITSLEHSLFESKSQKNTVENQLQKTELQIAGSSKQLNNTLKTLNTQQKLLATTQTQQAEYTLQLQQQQQVLNEQLCASYILGRQQYLKILLNQENPATVERYITYYRYLMNARSQAIQQIQVTLSQLEATAAAVNQQTQKLQNVKAQEQAITAKLTEEKQIRSQVLQQLERSIGSKQQQLAKLLQDKARLQSVITKVQTSNVYHPPASSVASTARGMPIAGGRMIQNYGQPLAGGRLFSSGILLSAPMGTPIHATAAGKVVFAHWLRGYGLLVIIQHNATYMSLYAHAESLYVQEGDEVTSGQVIATVGNSGGLTDPALYFEVTQNGLAIDPLKWIRKYS